MFYWDECACIIKSIFKLIKIEKPDTVKTPNLDKTSIFSTKRIG